MDGHRQIAINRNGHGAVQIGVVRVQLWSNYQCPLVWLSIPNSVMKVHPLQFTDTEICRNDSSDLFEVSARPCMVLRTKAMASGKKDKRRKAYQVNKGHAGIYGVHQRKHAYADWRDTRIMSDKTPRLNGI